MAKHTLDQAWSLVTKLEGELLQALEREEWGQIEGIAIKRDKVIKKVLDSQLGVASEAMLREKLADSLKFNDQVEQLWQAGRDDAKSEHQNVQSGRRANRAYGEIQGRK